MSAENLAINSSSINNNAHINYNADINSNSNNINNKTNNTNSINSNNNSSSIEEYIKKFKAEQKTRGLFKSLALLKEKSAIKIAKREKSYDESTFIEI